MEGIDTVHLSSINQSEIMRKEKSVLPANYTDISHVAQARSEMGYRSAINNAKLKNKNVSDSIQGESSDKHSAEGREHTHINFNDLTAPNN